nr:hypothetical protein [Actinomyces sp.]
MTATSYATTLNDLHTHLSAVTTAEELDALPPCSVILEWDDVALMKDYSGRWFAGGSNHRFTSDSIVMPVLLLWLGRNRGADGQ